MTCPKCNGEGFIIHHYVPFNPGHDYTEDCPLKCDAQQKLRASIDAKTQMNKRAPKVIHKPTNQEVFEAHQCGDCGEVYDRVPTTRGEDSLNVCGSCRTIEGNWDMVWVNDNGDVVATECDPEVEVAS